jgi:hypothetical protein
MQLAAVDSRGFECLTRRHAGRSAMEEQWFDRVAKCLGQRGGSRRWALQMVGAALTGAGLPAVLPETGAAGARKRCRRKGGRYLSMGTCHCAPTCGDRDPLPDDFHCRSDACYCFQTLEKTGFCAWIAGSITQAGCNSTSECKEPGTRCVMTGFPSDCRACPAVTCDTGEACVDGFCRDTHCMFPCPEGG